MTKLIEQFFAESNLSHLKKYFIDYALNRKHEIYFNAVDYLSPLYPYIEKEKLKFLAFASYGYFRSMLIVDGMIDNSQSAKSSEIANLLVLHESCIKELSFLFERNDKFWCQFDCAKATYTKTVKYEKTEWANLDDITEGDFEALAENKSASLFYSLIDALNSLQRKQHPNSQKIRELFKHLHIAFQYQDDIDDFKKDIANHQRTYAYFLVAQKINEKGWIELQSPDMKNKYLFTSGIAAKLLTKANEEYQKCKTIAEELNLKDLSIYVDTLIDGCQNQILEIDLLIEKTKVKSQKSSIYKSTDNADVNTIIKNAVSYLEKNIGSDQLWSDFMTTAGTSKYWVSYYAAYQLAEAGIELPILNDLLRRIINNELKGSYNKTIPEDGDTLNFICGFAMLKNQKTNLIGNWVEHNSNTGGWVTYLHEKSLRSRLKLNDDITLNGWLTPKVCVSAVACTMLRHSNELTNQRMATEQFLLKHQNTDGSWDAYWWTSPIYSTSWALNALSNDHNYEEVCEKAYEWIANRQNSDGSWSDSFTNEGSAFYTALAVKGLSFSRSENFEPPINKGVKWLMQNQTTDGSWKVNPVLAIPATDVESNNEVKKWRKSSFGVNVVVEDHNRVFTTATVVNALSQATKKNHSGNTLKKNKQTA